MELPFLTVKETAAWKFDCTCVYSDQMQHQRLMHHSLEWYLINSSRSMAGQALAL